MCTGMFQSPPHGVPIPEEVHQEYPPEVKNAWIVFDKWWKMAQKRKSNGPISRNGMPKKVRAAEQLILITPIPTMEEYTGADSCYMVYVQSQLVD